MRTVTRLSCLGMLTIAALAATSSGASADLLPSRSACPGQQNTAAPEHAQEKAMRCLINEVRSRTSSGSVGSHRDLERAAGRKAGDVKRCGFSHTACGNPADRWVRTTGYTNGTGGWKWGENLARGKGKQGSARNVVQAWLNSPPHRATMLQGSYEHLGIGLKRGRGRGSTAIWVLHLGCRGC